MESLLLSKEECFIVNWLFTLSGLGTVARPPARRVDFPSLCAAVSILHPGRGGEGKTQKDKPAPKEQRITKQNQG